MQIQQIMNNRIIYGLICITNKKIAHGSSLIQIENINQCDTLGKNHIKIGLLFNLPGPFSVPHAHLKRDAHIAKILH